jgi:TatA/E family protein of Tat protein translocase
MDIFGLGPMEIILILIIGLLIFGPEKLPKIGRDLGRAFRTFRKASSDLTNEVTKELEAEKLEKKDEPRQAAEKGDTPNKAT